MLCRHGGGFCICNKYTHRKICVELALRARVAVIFASYSLAPEAKFPLAIYECLESLQWTVANADSLRVDADKLVVCGDSSGGNFAAAVSRTYIIGIQYLAFFFLPRLFTLCKCKCSSGKGTQHQAGRPNIVVSWYRPGHGRSKLQSNSRKDTESRVKTWKQFGTCIQDPRIDTS